MLNFDINKIKKDNLSRIMDEKGISQAQLAKLINVKPPYIAAILKNQGEEGFRNIGEKTIVKLCRGLRIEPKEFYVFEQNNDALVFSKRSLNKYKYLAEIKRRIKLAIEKDLPEEVLYENIKAEMDTALRELRAIKKEAVRIQESHSAG